MSFEIALYDPLEFLVDKMRADKGLHSELIRSILLQRQKIIKGCAIKEFIEDFQGESHTIKWLSKSEQDRIQESKIIEEIKTEIIKVLKKLQLIFISDEDTEWRGNLYYYENQLHRYDVIELISQSQQGQYSYSTPDGDKKGKIFYLKKSYETTQYKPGAITTHEWMHYFGISYNLPIDDLPIFVKIQAVILGNFNAEQLALVNGLDRCHGLAYLKSLNTSLLTDLHVYGLKEDNVFDVVKIIMPGQYRCHSGGRPPATALVKNKKPRNNPS